MANVKNIKVNDTNYNIVDAQSAHNIQMDVDIPKRLLLKNYADNTLGYVDIPTGASIVPGTWTNKTGNGYASFTYSDAIPGDIIAIAPGDPDTFAVLEYNPNGRNIGDVITLEEGFYLNRTELYDTQRTTYLIKVTDNRYMDITDRNRSPFIVINSVSSVDDAIAKLIHVLGKAAHRSKNSPSDLVVDLYNSNDQLIEPTDNVIVWGCDGLAYNIQYFSSTVTMAYAKCFSQVPLAIQGLCSNWANVSIQSLSSVVPGIYTSDLKYTPIYTPAASNCVIIVYRYLV